MTNRFSALHMHEPTETFLSDTPFMPQAQEQPQKASPDDANLATPGNGTPGIILEDDLVTLAIEGVRFILVSINPTIGFMGELLTQREAPTQATSTSRELLD